MNFSAGQMNLHFFASQVRYETIFSEIKKLLARDGIPLILLKGPHLAHAVYDHPQERLYGDLDILVKPRDFRRAAGILAANRFSLVGMDERSPATFFQTNHWIFRARTGQFIELHRGFAGLGRHRVDLDAWFGRAETFQYGLTAAQGLSSEDLLCHLCLHIGKGFFYLIEPKHIMDLDRIVRRRTIDWDAFVTRCREARACTIAFYCLSAASARYGTPVPPDVQMALRPGRWRRSWLDRHLDVGKFPVYRFHRREVGHARRRLTLPLLDGVSSWIPFIARAMAVKGVDILSRIPLMRRWCRRRFSLSRFGSGDEHETKTGGDPRRPDLSGEEKAGRNNED